MDHGLGSFVEVQKPYLLYCSSLGSLRKQIILLVTVIGILMAANLLPMS